MGFDLSGGEDFAGDGELDLFVQQKPQKQQKRQGGLCLGREQRKAQHERQALHGGPGVEGLPLSGLGLSVGKQLGGVELHACPYGVGITDALEDTVLGLGLWEGSSEEDAKGDDDQGFGLQPRHHQQTPKGGHNGGAAPWVYDGMLEDALPGSDEEVLLF